MQDPHELKQPCLCYKANIVRVFAASSAGAERGFSLVNLLNPLSA